MPARVYVDNAATSWPKPPGVADAVHEYLTGSGAPAGRSGYGDAIRIDAAIEETRRALARLLGVADPRCLAFTANGTDSLNQAIHGVLRPGDRVVTTVTEHNSVLRPLRELQQSREVEVVTCPLAADGLVDQQTFSDAIRQTTRLVVINHASNVTGRLQPLDSLISEAKRQSALVLVDGAQTAGHLPSDLTQSGVDLWAAPAHKGLLAPPGLGVLYVHPDLHPSWQFSRCGGTGTASDEDRQPRDMPTMLEVGSPNVTGILGLQAALAYFNDQRPVDEIARHERRWGRQLHERLAELPMLSWLSAWHDDNLAVISFQVDGFAPQEFAAMLDAVGGVQVRAGFHCAPLMHASLGTAPGGGTIRISGGPFNTDEEIDTIVDTIQAVAAMH